MSNIEKSILLPYSQDKLYHLISDIAQYPEFLPWCERIKITEQGLNHLTAKLYASYKGATLSFTTDNTNKEPESITFKLREGPFKHLEGQWLIDKIDDHACKIHFRLDYAFNNYFVEKMLGPVIQTMIGQYVDAFVARAKSIYH